MHWEKRRRSAAIFVLGCKVNQAEASGMTQILEHAGYEVSGRTSMPDLVIVNTCCVTSKAEGKSRRLVSRLGRMYPDALILVSGCLAEISPSCFDVSDSRLVVYRQSDRAQLKNALMHYNKFSLIQGQESDVHEFVDFGVTSCPTKAREFIKIQDGCSSNCSYCIVPKARGPARSLRFDTVLDHVDRMANSGVTEIVLSGVNLGTYGEDFSRPLKLESLLVTLLKREPGPRFRLSSLEPEHITTDIIGLAAQHDRLCNHFHIPLQSGDDGILRLMNRPYNTSFIRSSVKNIFSQLPDACVGFDVIVGFPGETEEAFTHTVEFVEDCRASYLHVFPFSARPGTQAAELNDGVPDTIVRQRVQILRDLSFQLRKKFFERCLGKTYSMVVESGPDPQTEELIVRTDNYIPVFCPVTPELVIKKKGRVTLLGFEKGRVIGRAF